VKMAFEFIGQFASAYPVAFYTILCILSLAIVLKSSDLAIYAIFFTVQFI